MRSVTGWLKDNSLSLSMFCLFAACLFGDSLTGLHTYNSWQANQDFPQLDYWQYLGTGSFLDGLFVNWQAAILQLTTLIIFSEFMVQRGASHSRKPEGEAKARKSQAKRRSGAESRSRWQATWLYRNSLSLAFIAMFCGAFALHVVYGAQAYNEQRALLHQPPIDIGAYLISAKLWTDTFQTWEAEFFVMGVFLVATIYLRQEYSAESKTLGAGIDETGSPNE